ncbi:MAG: AraC family transcriptional regulator [Chitinispirillales bacterium]|jgi:AraC-like DNA-binding protein|nr:AraC family transcriptional regulator [Chitinispirillales bacterium]
MRLFKLKLTTLPLFAVLAVACAASVVRAQSNCISFEAPLAGSVFSTPSCTIALRVDCPNVTRVDLQARYFPEGSDSALIVSLGTITRPPFKLVWNTHNLPNQLFAGVGILAEALISGEAPRIARQEGIFLTHSPVARKTVPVPYSPSSVKVAKETHAQSFSLGDPRRSAKSMVVWNERELVVHVTVNDPSFYTNQPGRNNAEAGLEILIDPARGRAPYPAEGTMYFTVPLSGSPFRTDYRVEKDDGTFRLVPQSSRVAYPHHVGLGEFRGYNFRFAVPRESFGGRIPDTIGLNLVLNVPDDDGRIQKISLAGSSVYEIYSPFIWSDYYRLSKPLLMNAALQWIVFPAAGFLLALLIYALISKLRRPQLLSSFERTEEERIAFERVNNIIERELVRADLKIDYVAHNCGMEPQALSNLIKRNTGFTFINYLLFCRTEVAKERLRSSRSSEKSIADLCGFSSALEMEKCFIKFHRTTPYKFRTQQQVA